MFCPQCGTENVSEAKFCENCGHQLPQQPAKKPAPSAPKKEKEKPLREFRDSDSKVVRGEEKTASGRRKVILIGGPVGGALLLLVIAAFVFLDLPILRSERVLILSEPNDDREITLVKWGKDLKDGTVLEEEVTSPSADIDFYHNDGSRRYIGRFRGSSRYASFGHGSKDIFLWYGEDEETVIQHLRVGADEPMKVMDTDDDLRITIVNNFEFLFIEEEKDGEEKCYVATPGEEAERVGEGDFCGISQDGSRVYFGEKDDEETSISVVDVNGKNEVVLLDEVEGVVKWRISDDASRVAYVVEDDDNEQLYLVDRRGAEEKEIGDDVFDIGSFGFSPNGDTLFYVIQEDDGDEEEKLYTSNSEEVIAEAFQIIFPSFDQDGRYLVYVIENEDGEETIFVHPMRGGDEVELKAVSEEDRILYGQFYTDPYRIVFLVDEEDEYTFYSAAPDGSDVVELHDEDEVTGWNLNYLVGSKMLYIIPRSEEGTRGLFVTPVHQEKGFYLMDLDWYMINLLNISPDGKRIVLTAKEDSDDQPVLYCIKIEEGAELIELDDDGDRFWNAVFSSNGNSVIYSVREDDDYEVRRVKVTGEQSPETVYEDAELLDVSWGDLAPWFW